MYYRVNTLANVLALALFERDVNVAFQKMFLGRGTFTSQKTFSGGLSLWRSLDWGTLGLALEECELGNLVKVIFP